MEKVYHIGDISRLNSDIEKTVFYVKKVNNSWKVRSYVEKNGVLSSVVRCEDMCLDENGLLFFKELKKKFLINNKLSMYVEQRKEIRKITKEEVLNKKSPIYLINKDKNFGLIFANTEDFKNLFLNLDEIEKNINGHSYVKRL